MVDFHSGNRQLENTQTFDHEKYPHDVDDDNPSSRHNMPPKARKPPIYQKHKKFNRVIDLEDIEDPGDVSSSPQFRPPPRFTTVRTPKVQAPTQPQPHKPPPDVSESRPAKSSRFLDEIDPDLVAASSEPLKPGVKKKKRNAPVTEPARLRPSSLVAGIQDSTPTSYQQPQFRTSPLFTGRAVETSQHQNTLEPEPLLGISASRNAGAEIVAPEPRPWKPSLPASSARDRSARRSRFRDELDPDLLALATTSKRKTRINLNVPLKPVLAASEDCFDSPRRRMPIRNVDSHVSRPTPVQELKSSGLQRTASSLATISPQDIPDLAALSPTNRNPTPDDILSDRTKGELSRSLARTPGGLQHDEFRAVVVQSHSISFNKRPRARSSSSLDFVPDTPQPKRQQQEDQRQIDADTLTLRSPIGNTGSGAITVIPQSEDEIEDPESPAKPARLSNPPQKREIPEIDLSPTALVKLRKRQKTSVEGEDIIEDNPSSPLIRVRRHRVLPKGIYDASSSGDEIAENINVRDLNAKLEALASTQLPSFSSTQTSKAPKPRQLMSLDAIRLRLNTKPTPAPQPALKPGMIHLLTHHKRLVIPRNPTPPPPSPPRRGYVEHGLAEAAMWWKHDAKELTLRSVFTDDKPKLTFRILVQEFLRDGDMCIVKGSGEGQSGREGRVKAIVTNRIASAVTRAGLTLFYERPWLPVTLFGEAEPYRILIGRWDVRDVGIKKAKKAKKAEKEENTKEPKEKEKPKADQVKAKEKIRKAESAKMAMDTGKMEVKKIEKAKKAKETENTKESK